MNDLERLQSTGSVTYKSKEAAVVLRSWASSQGVAAVLGYSALGVVVFIPATDGNGAAPEGVTTR